MRSDSVKKIFFIIILLSFFPAWMDPFRDIVSKGNGEYSDGKFGDALKSYKKAEKYVPDDNKKNMLEFNKGNAEFRMNNYDSAIARYRSSINSGDPDVQKKALYNIGTVYMKTGKKKEAAESFIKALQIDPSYDRAKKNLEYLIKKNDQDKNNQNDDQKSGNNKDQKNSNRGKGNSGQGSDGDNKNSTQMKNMLESMKNKPVRRQKGNGNGKKYLENYW